MEDLSGFESPSAVEKASWRPAFLIHTMTFKVFLKKLVPFLKVNTINSIN